MNDHSTPSNNSSSSSNNTLQKTRVDNQEALQSKKYFSSIVQQPSFSFSLYESTVVFYLFFIYSWLNPEKNSVYNKISITKYNANSSQLTTIKLFNKSFCKNICYENNNNSNHNKNEVVILWKIQ